MKHWLEEGGIVHAENANGDDRTLCGVILEGIEGQDPMSQTDLKIDCADCIGFIEHAKKFRAGEYVSTQRGRR